MKRLLLALSAMLATVCCAIAQDATYGTNFFNVPNWTTSKRMPTVSGALGYNKDSGALEWWNGSAWTEVGARGSTINPTDPPYNAKCDGDKDDTLAINMAVAALQARGGGTLVLPSPRSGTATRLCKMTGPLAPTYTGANSPTQSPLRITSAAGASPDSYLANSIHGNVTPIGGAGLDLQYSTLDGTHVAAIDTRGAGVLEIDHITIVNNGSGTIPLIQTTNTTLKIHDNVISGTAACSGTTCQQDAIILGGNSTTNDTTLATNASNSGFQGYGSVIERNHFSHLRHLGVWGSAANAVVWERNTSDLTCGSAGSAADIVGSISGTTLTVTSTSVKLVSGYSIPQAAAGTYITGQLTGSAGSSGTYSLSGSSQTVASVTSVTAPDAPYVLTGAGYGATGNILRDNTIEIGGYSFAYVMRAVANGQVIKLNGISGNGVWDESPTYTIGQLWVSPAETGANAYVSYNTLIYSSADPALGDNAVMGDSTASELIQAISFTGKGVKIKPSTMVVGPTGSSTKVGIQNSSPGYLLDLGSGASMTSPAVLNINGNTTPYQGPMQYFKYGGVIHGFIGPYTSFTGSGGWDGIGALLWYDGLVLGTNNTKYWQMDKKGHISSLGTAPSVSIGTGATIESHSTDTSGTVTSGSGNPASGTVTFNQAFATWNHCRVTPHSLPSGWTYSVSLTAITVNAANLTGVVFDYDCDGS